MRIEEREKDIRAQEIIEIFIEEFYRVLGGEESVFNPITTCFDFGGTNKEFRVRGPANYDEALERFMKRTRSEGDVKAIPINMTMEIHTFMRKHNPDYEAGDYFPKMVIQFQEESRFGYSPTNKTFYILFGEEYRKSFSLYLERLSDTLNPVGAFYSFLENTLYKGNQPSKMLVHEISHMFDDFMEFDLDVSDPSFVGDDEFGKSDDEQVRKRRALKGYYNDPVEMEAYLREEVFTYYKEAQGLFQYIAQELAEGQDASFLIKDIIEDIIEGFKTKKDPFGFTMWELWRKRNRRKMVIRVASAIESLLAREVEKLGNN